MCLAARSGIGMGIVIDGRIYTGNGGLSGKVGWTVLPRDGGPQTMTELVSAKGIVGQALRLLKSERKTPLRKSLLEKGDDLSLGDLVAAADAGDRRIRALLEQVGTDLGLVTANLANLFAPEKIILAGEVPSCCPLVRQTLEQGFRRYTLGEILRATVLADGALSGFAGAMGARLPGIPQNLSPGGNRPARSRRLPRGFCRPIAGWEMNSPGLMRTASWPTFNSSHRGVRDQVWGQTRPGLGVWSQTRSLVSSRELTSNLV